MEGDPNHEMFRIIAIGEEQLELMDKYGNKLGLKIKKNYLLIILSNVVGSNQHLIGQYFVAVT